MKTEDTLRSDKYYLLLLWSVKHEPGSDHKMTIN